MEQVAPQYGRSNFKLKCQTQRSCNAPWRLGGELQTRYNIKMGPSGYINNYYENNLCELFLELGQKGQSLA